MSTKRPATKKFRKTFYWVSILFVLQTLQVFPGDIYSSCASECLPASCLVSECLPAELLHAATISRKTPSSPYHFSSKSTSTSAFRLRQGTPNDVCHTFKQHILMGEEEVVLPSRDSDSPDDLQSCARTHRSFNPFPGQRASVLATVFYTPRRSSTIFLFNQAFRI